MSLVIAGVLALPVLQRAFSLDLSVLLLGGLGAGASLLLAARYPGVLLGLYASGSFSLPFLFVPTDVNPLTGWSLVPVAALLVYFVARRESMSLPLNKLVLSQALFGVVLFAGLARTTGDPSLALTKASRFAYLNLVLFISPMFFVGDIRRQWNVLRGYLLGAVVWGIAVYLHGEPAGGRLGFDLIGGAIGYGRATGIACTLMMSAMIMRPRSGVNLAFVPITAWLLHGTILSGTRGALLAFLVALCAAGALGHSKTLSRRNAVAASLVITGGLLVVGLLLINSPPEIMARYMELGQGPSGASAAFRLQLYSLATDMFAAAPVIGMGTGAYPAELLYPHNIFLEVAAEQGLVGLVLLCMFLVLTVKYGLQVLRRSEYGDLHKTTAALCLAGLTFFLVEAQFSGDITDNRMIWFFSGVVWAVSASAAASDPKACDKRTVATPPPLERGRSPSSVGA